jgi:hypothetical protein
VNGIGKHSAYYDMTTMVIVKRFKGAGPGGKKTQNI